MDSAKIQRREEAIARGVTGWCTSNFWAKIVTAGTEGDCAAGVEVFLMLTINNEGPAKTAESGADGWYRAGTARSRLRDRGGLRYRSLPGQETKCVRVEEAEGKVWRYWHSWATHYPQLTTQVSLFR